MLNLEIKIINFSVRNQKFDFQIDIHEFQISNQTRGYFLYLIGRVII